MYIQRKKERGKGGGEGWMEEEYPLFISSLADVAGEI